MWYFPMYYLCCVSVVFLFPPSLLLESWCLASRYVYVTPIKYRHIPKWYCVCQACASSLLDCICWRVINLQLHFYIYWEPNTRKLFVGQNLYILCYIFFDGDKSELLGSTSPKSFRWAASSLHIDCLNGTYRQTSVQSAEWDYSHVGFCFVYLINNLYHKTIALSPNTLKSITATYSWHFFWITG